MYSRTVAPAVVSSAITLPHRSWTKYVVPLTSPTSAQARPFSPDAEQVRTGVAPPDADDFKTKTNKYQDWFSPTPGEGD